MTSRDSDSAQLLSADLCYRCRTPFDVNLGRSISEPAIRTRADVTTMTPQLRGLSS